MNIVEKLAIEYANEEFNLRQVKLPSIKDFKGRKAYIEFQKVMKEASNRMKHKEMLYENGISEYGDKFYELVEKERMRIGKEVFGF